MIILPYRRPTAGGGGGGSTPILDTYGADIVLGISLRQIKTGITNVIRGNRVSDNTEQDFTESEITDGTLTSFAGGGAVEVIKWYDASGNAYDVNDGNTAPRIVDASGNLITRNGKPVVESDGTTQNMSRPSLGLTNSSGLTIAMVYRCPYDKYGGLICDSSPTNVVNLRPWGGLKYSYSGPKVTTQNGNYVLLTLVHKSDDTLLAWENGVSTLNSSYTLGSGADPFRLFTRSWSSATAASISELLIWHADKSADLPDIEADMMAYWGL